MFDGQKNAIQVGAMTQIETSDEEALLVQACFEFWQLEHAKESLIAGEGVVHLSIESREKLYGLQQQLTGTLHRIWRSTVNGTDAFKEKLKVLKYLAVASDFQDTEIFRELVTFLDGCEFGDKGIASVQWQGSQEPERRSRKFSLQNILGIFNN